ncbi:MAG: penicillin-binding protein 1C [Planctomycetes bacterium]|nr:penicillin-binding protein 1C [Planctomycetota bacterium]
MTGALAKALRGLRRGARLRHAAAVALGFSAGCLVGLGVLWLASPYAASRLDAYPAGLRVADREGGILRVYPSARGELRLPVKLEDLSPWLPKAVVAIEDRRFRSHLGVDPFAVARAIVQNVRRGRICSGASTITQQLVRILDERPRTVGTKLVEAFRALQLEAQRSKDALLEAYLNLVPMGGNLRGVEAAAMRYFGKPARDLDLAEAALLAGLPQSPARLRPDVHPERAFARRRVVLEAMAREGMISREELEAADARREPVRLHPWPFAAPHLADAARAAARGSGSAPGAGLVRTTLDREAQAAAERALGAFFAADPPGRERLSGAVVAIEAGTGAVRAMVGSPGFFDVARKGTLNAALRPRSPGSALKPFAYAVAFEKGLATPETVLLDTPLAYSAFLPQNFDRLFLGPVTAREALSLSLNVPAVRLQERIGTASLLETLRALGLRTLSRPAARYGLTLIVGGCEVTLADLTGAYAALLRHGAARPWTLLEAEAREDGGLAARVLSPGACRLVLEALSGEEHLCRAVPGIGPRAGALLGYKTGTSFGLRDAWCVAFTREHAVGVWIGDPAGKPHPDLVGLRAAAPVALEVAQALSRLGGAAAPPWPPDAEVLGTRRVCSRTGLPAGRHCPETLEGRFPLGAPAPSPCDVHREVLVDALSGLELCRSCARGRETERRVVEAWPADAEAWLRRHGGGLERSPHAPWCREAPEAGRVKILTPAEGSEYRLEERSLGEEKVFLSAAASRQAARLHWFVDGDLVATASPVERVPWPLERGAHWIRCVDDRGLGAVVRIRVR